MTNTQIIEDRPRPFDPLADIVEFHTKFGLEYNGKPRALPEDMAGFRRDFNQEELDEWHLHHRRATFNDPTGIDAADYTHHLEQMLDAHVDQMYVLLGTVYLQGLAAVFAEAWRRVHERNMAKVRVENVEQSTAGSGRGSVYDVVKPPGWYPPSHTDLVEDNDRNQL